MDTTVGGQTPVMLAQITPNMYQPRMTFNPAPMMELAQSIRSGGLVQPIVIQPGDNYHAEGKFDYTIVAGERRWRACCALAVAQHRNPGDDDTLSSFVEHICGNPFDFLETHRALLEQTTIAATISTPTTGAALLIRATIENLHRADLNPVELGKAYQRLSDDGLTDAEIANAVGLGDKARSTVANARRLVKLPPDMQEAVATGVISASVALAYLPAMDIKPHLIGEAKLDNQPNFPASNIPTPAALRKRLCEPDKHGGTLSRDMVRVLVERMVDRCTPVPCADCGRNTKVFGYAHIDNQIFCHDCHTKRKKAEAHPRWCPNCRQEQQLDGLQISTWARVPCNECGKSFAGCDWRKDAPIDHSKIEYRKLQLEESPTPTSTVYCPECGTSRDMEVSRIKNGLGSRCDKCHARHPANEWLTTPPAPKQTNGNGHTKPIEPAPWESKDTKICTECGKDCTHNPKYDKDDLLCIGCYNHRLLNRTVTRYCERCGHAQEIPERFVVEWTPIACQNCYRVDQGTGKWLEHPKQHPDTEYLEAEHTHVCACGRLLSPNDIKLGYTECKECEAKRLEAEAETSYYPTADDIKERFAELLSLCGPDRLAELDAALDDLEAELFPETTAELQANSTRNGL